MPHEGIADEPSGVDLERVQSAYFAVYPDGRDRRARAGITYIRVRSTWIRYSNYNVDPPQIAEFRAAELLA